MRYRDGRRQDFSKIMQFYQKHMRNLFWSHWFIKLRDDSHPSNLWGLVMPNTQSVQWVTFLTCRPFFKEMWFIDHTYLEIKTYPMCLHVLLSLLTGDDGCTPRVLKCSPTMLAATVWRERWGMGWMDTVLPHSMWNSLVSLSSRLISLQHYPQ